VLFVLFLELACTSPKTDFVAHQERGIFFYTFSHSLSTAAKFNYGKLIDVKNKNK
jgi:hypothetical protein